MPTANVLNLHECTFCHMPVTEDAVRGDRVLHCGSCGAVTITRPPDGF